MNSVILEMKKNPVDINKTMDLVKQNQIKCNSFVTILENPKNEIKDGALSNIPYALKDNISTKDILTTASSNTLRNYVPVYSATVYELLNASGAVLVGKTTMDEFGLGGTGTTGHTGIVKNPWDTTRQAGGSSAGSAAVVASKALPFSIGSDTGDSIRKPASFCGIVGYKPTYGLISRHGLFAFASSLDHVGVLTRSVVDAAIITDIIKGKDSKDMTSIDSFDMHLEEALKKEISNKKCFYIKEIVEVENYESPSDELKETLNLFQETLKIARDNGISVEPISIDSNLLQSISAIYTCISCAEATSNLSNLTGIVFGTRANVSNIDDLMKKHRTDGFSPLIKRRLVIGSYALQKENQEKYFLNAQRARRLIVNQMNALFETYDAMILPACSGGADSLNTIECIKKSDTLALENHMVIGNFGGFPSITIPNGFINRLPVGINITAKVKDDENLLQIAYHLEQIIAWKGEIK